MSERVREWAPAGPTGVRVADIAPEPEAALAEVVVESPVKLMSCTRCEHRERCREHHRVTGHLLCEPLTGWDLLVAAQNGVLQETVHWRQCPRSMETPEGVAEYLRGVIDGR